MGPEPEMDLARVELERIAENLDKKGLKDLIERARLEDESESEKARATVTGLFEEGLVTEEDLREALEEMDEEDGLS